MMIAERLPRAVLEERSREAYRLKFPEGRPRGDPPANARPLLLMVAGDHVRVPYRGREYELGYVSFEDGVRLVLAQAAIDELNGTNKAPDPEAVARLLEGMRTIVSMCPRYLLPVGGRVRRFLWRLGIRRNPFKDATDTEVGQFLGFFLESRMRSRARYPTPAQDGARAAPTS